MSPEVVALLQYGVKSCGGVRSVWCVSLRPDYLVLRSFEVDINQHYHGGDLFETEEQRGTFNRLYEGAAAFRCPLYRKSGGVSPT